jgi:hypothetical protein
LDCAERIAQAEGKCRAPEAEEKVMNSSSEERLAPSEVGQEKRDGAPSELVHEMVLELLRGKEDERFFEKR